MLELILQSFRLVKKKNKIRFFLNSYEIISHAIRIPTRVISLTIQKSRYSE